MNKKIYAVCAMLCAASLFGANWDGIGGDYNGDYQNPLMWSTGLVPGDLDLVYFLRSGAYTVTVSAAVTNLTTEFRGPGNAAYNVNVALASNAKLTSRTNFFVRGGTVAYPARVAFNGGTLEVINSLQSSNGGLNDKYAELYLTNTTFLAGGNYFYVGPGNVCNAFVIGPGSTYNGPQIVMGDQGNATSNRIEVSGANALLAISNNQIRVGLSGKFNSLTITNGGQVTLQSIAMGTNPGGDSNRITCVDGGLALLGGNVLLGGNGSYNTTYFGPGSRLTAASGGGTFYVGQDKMGSYNRVTFDGAAVTNYLNSLYVGNAMTNLNNTLEIMGGTFINSNATCYIGNYGSGNALLVTGGTTFYTKSSLVCGYQNTAFGNRAVFADSDVAIGGDIYMGQNGGCSNTIAFTNCSLALVGTTYIGHNAATGNVFIAGTGTSITSLRRFLVSSPATAFGNQMIFDNAQGIFGTTVSGAAYIGENGHGNLLRVRGTNGLLVNVNAALYVGYYGSYNRLLVEDGGRVVCNGLLIGDQNSSSNFLYLAGAGSRIDSTGNDVRLGAGSSTGSVAVVAADAVLDAGDRSIGLNYGSTTYGAVLAVSNAVVLATNYNFTTYNDAVVAFAGSNNLLRAKTLVLRDTTALAFAIPRAGLLSTNAVIQIDQNATFTGTPVLKIAAADWAARTGGKITLLTYGGTLSGDLAALASGAQIDTASATVTVVGKSLVLTAPRRDGTVIRLY